MAAALLLSCLEGTTLPQVQHLALPTIRVRLPATDVQTNEEVWQPSGRLVDATPSSTPLTCDPTPCSS
jgi:hypothetical protein